MTTPLTPEDRPDRKRAAALIIGSALVSAIGVGAVAYTATSAAFSGTTDNLGNNFAAATVTLTDDDFGGANFNVTDMIPGDSAADCIEVTYTGSSTDLFDLRLYGTTAGVLADDLTLDVQHGAVGETCATAVPTLTGVYNGDLDALGATYVAGSAGFTPTATGETVPYFFDVTLKAATLNSQQGETASADFIWEVRSN
jgi:hypothetical protein